mmetsp:Transcript_35300/g.71966  ORF Transcript_35300/g.71966 Transcript_35300/m.71966 type:complete len:102 (+) Transcript_35300:427-732(+)
MASIAKKMIPLADRVLVQRVVAKAQTAGGIFLPDSAANAKMSEGTVVAVGPGARNAEGTVFPVSVAVGDSVLLPEYGGSPVKIGEEELFLFKEFEILGKFE